MVIVYAAFHEAHGHVVALRERGGRHQGAAHGLRRETRHDILTRVST